VHCDPLPQPAASAHDVRSSCRKPKRCSTHAHAVDVIIAEELQRQEYAAAWEADAAAAAAVNSAAVGAALYDLAISGPQTETAQLAAWSDGDEPMPMDCDQGGLQCADAEQPRTLLDAQVRQLERGGMSAVAIAHEEITRQLKVALAPLCSESQCQLRAS